MVTREKVMSYKGLFADKDLTKFLLRLILLAFCVGSILLFIVFPKFET